MSLPASAVDSSTGAAASGAYVEYVLRIADSSLILGHRLSEWCGHGPVLEEDIALTNVALDLIGQARSLYTHAGALEGHGRDEDHFAFARGEEEFRNLTIVELPNGDYAHTIVRNLLFTAFQRELWTALFASADPRLAEIARKSLTETQYHVRHASDWTIRLGDGTEESHTRMQGALDTLWPFTAEFFSGTLSNACDNSSGVHIAAAGLPDWSTFERSWYASVRAVLDAATLQIPERSSFLSHGKLGRHSAHLKPLLMEMQHLQRAYPNCKW